MRGQKTCDLRHGRRQVRIWVEVPKLRTGRVGGQVVGRRAQCAADRVIGATRLIGGIGCQPNFAARSCTLFMKPALTGAPFAPAAIALRISASLPLDPVSQGAVTSPHWGVGVASAPCHQPLSTVLSPKTKRLS